MKEVDHKDAIWFCKKKSDFARVASVASHELSCHLFSCDIWHKQKNLHCNCKVVNFSSARLLLQQHRVLF